MPISRINTNSIANNTIQGADLLDASITAAKIISVANTQITGNIVSSQITSIGGSQITANTIANSAIQTGAVENYMRGASLDFGMRNRIINGAMVIDQRNAGASVTPTNGQFTLDRYQAVLSQASKFSVQQNAGSVTPPVGFANYLGVTSLSAYTVGATEIFTFQQAIEGYNIADLNWGSANAKTVTFSFQVRSSLTGTFGGVFSNSAGDRTYPFTYSIPVANTWTSISITIAGDTSGTWLTTNGLGILIRIGLGVGSTYSGTAGAWSGTTYYGATGATSVVGTNGATFYITGVQLEKGSTATSFDYRSIGTELALCQRYCYAQNKLVTNNYYAFGMGFGTSGATGQLGTPYPVSMRSNPSATYSAANLFFVDAILSTTNAFTGITADQNGNNYGYSSFTGGTSTTNGGAGRWLANGASAAYVIWSAEL